jgi:hypothetical protein
MEWDDPQTAIIQREVTTMATLDSNNYNFNPAIQGYQNQGHQGMVSPYTSAYTPLPRFTQQIPQHISQGKWY